MALADGTGDAEYLAALDDALETVQREFRPQMVWYQGGVDPFEGDRLGRLSLSLDGLRRRDVRVLSFFRNADVPVVTTNGRRLRAAGRSDCRGPLSDRARRLPAGRGCMSGRR